MGIDDLDTWEYNYVKDLEGHNLLAWTDEEAIERYASHSYLYNKLELSRLTKVPTILCAQ